MNLANIEVLRILWLSYMYGYLLGILTDYVVEQIYISSKNMVNGQLDIDVIIS